MKKAILTIVSIAILGMVYSQTKSLYVQAGFKNIPIGYSNFPDQATQLRSSPRGNVPSIGVGVDFVRASTYAWSAWFAFAPSTIKYEKERLVSGSFIPAGDTSINENCYLYGLSFKGNLTGNYMSKHQILYATDVGFIGTIPALALGLNYKFKPSKTSAIELSTRPIYVDLGDSYDSIITPINFSVAYHISL